MRMQVHGAHCFCNLASLQANLPPARRCSSAKRCFPTARFNCKLQVASSLEGRRATTAGISEGPLGPRCCLSIAVQQVAGKVQKCVVDARPALYYQTLEVRGKPLHYPADQLLASYGLNRMVVTAVDV
ncbi:unnamed protein product [Polarella glacialis]|uniref:Uncharacterized protein n=1 Tax=Polarella glacialis TaxID=89957 RepID=A0A813GCM6_POLGL|nr:unnamed protein product [Polarella glacialis]